MPPISFWFTGTALYLAASFVFAIGVGLIGIKDMIPKKLFYVLLAFAVLLSGTAWRVAAQQEQDSFNQDQILDGISKSIGQIASATNVNPNQSSDELAEKIIEKFNDLQSQINQTKSSVQQLQNPPLDPNTFYQNGQVIGDVQGTFTIEPQSVTFQVVTSNGKGDPSKPIQFQNWVLSCPGLPSPAPDTFVGSFNGMVADLQCSILSKTN